MKVQIKLDQPGIRSLLRSAEVRAALTPFANAIASQVRSRGADVVVDSYTTDRAAMSVTVRDKRAMLWQARDGLLTRAAAATGLEVKSK